MKMSKKSMPWRDDLGNPLPDEKLKEVAKKWSIQDWKNFQKWGMGHGGRIGDILPEGQDIEEVFSEEDNIWDLCSSETSASMKPKIPDLKRHLRKLAGKEYRVLKHYFLDAMTDREIASLMGERWETVKTRRKRAVKKLQRFFEEEKRKTSGSDTSENQNSKAV